MEELRSEHRSIQIQRVFRRHMPDPAPGLVDTRKRKLCLHRCCRPDTRDGSSAMWKKNIVGIEKHQDRMPRQRPGTVQRSNLVSVRLPEYGADSIAIACDNCSRAVR